MTISKSQFRIIVGAGFLVGILSIIVGLVGESSFPIELQKYVEEYYEKPFGFFDIALLIIALIAMVAYFGIFFFAKWAKNLFTATYILSCIGMVVDEVVIQSGMEAALSELSVFCAGAIVACMYISNIRDYFIKESA